MLGASLHLLVAFTSSLELGSPLSGQFAMAVFVLSHRAAREDLSPKRARTIWSHFAGRLPSRVRPRLFLSALMNLIRSSLPLMQARSDIRPAH